MEQAAMTQDDVLFGYRLQLFDLAARTNVSHACRTFGVHRSTYYRWKKQVDASGLEMLRPRERRHPQMPNAFPRIVEERILAFAIANPGLGPRRLQAQLERHSGLRASANGIWRVLCRHGLSTRAKRLALVAGYRAPYEPPREAEPEPRVESSRPGELVGFDSFFVGRLHGTAGAVWQLTACDTFSSFGWAELVRCPSGQPDQAQTSRFARRVAKELARMGWRLERAITDNGNEFNRPGFPAAIEALGATQTRIRPGRPQSNGHVERLHRTILEECWRPAFARYLQVRYRGLQRELSAYMRDYNFERSHTGLVCDGRTPAEVVYGARKMEPR
jgi:transposase InsO family protein